ncbi:adenine nucleotide alpha hydrolases-like protein [Meredithblackwellia eburnea MCA 4105]
MPETPPATSSSSTTSLQRPLIDITRHRSSSRDPHVRTGSSSSIPGTGGGSTSPYGSPKESGFMVGSPPLRSALKQPRLSPGGTTIAGSAVSLGSGTSGEEGERGREGQPSLTKLDLGFPKKEDTGSGGGKSLYSRRVGFDTFESGVELDEKGSNTGGGTGVNYTFSVSAKSAHYCRGKHTRTYMVGTDLNEYSVHALHWALDSLVDSNDELVILRVVDPSEKNKPRGMNEAREEAEEVLEEVMRRNGDEKEISIVVEFAIGEVEETIHRMIEIYKPDSLIVGTRGIPDSIFKSAFMGSISRYCVAKSPVPVVVVRPEDKVRESLSRRLNDDKKQDKEKKKGLDLKRFGTFS